MIAINLNNNNLYYKKEVQVILLGVLQDNLKIILVIFI